MGVYNIDISKKVLLITLLIFAVLTAAFTFTHTIQLSNFLKLEHTDTLEDVDRVQKVISIEQEHLNETVQDWACWDDTYRFIGDRNQHYIDVNLPNQTLAGIKMNVMIFVDNSGSVVYAKAVDLNTSKEEPVPDDLLKLIENGTLLTKSEGEKINGFVLLEETPMFIACHPILTTNKKGPVKGTLIFGKYFDDDLLDIFEDVTYSSLLMYRADENMSPDFQTIFKKLSANPEEIVVEPLRKDRIAGYFELKDISGQPALLIRADFPRELYLHGERALNYMYFFLLLTGFMTGAGVKFALDKLFISRLTRIDDFVTNVRSEKDLSKRLSLDDDDELYRLSREINGMLNEIGLTEQELKAQEREKKALLDSMNELVIFVNPELNIIWANKAALEYMKMSLKEAVGKNLKSSPEVSGPFSDYLHLEQVFATGNKKSGEFKGDEGRVWFIQAIPITEADGKIIGVLEMSSDITEKEKAEQLRKKEINHRIKNNLQIVSSLLDLQADKFSDKKVIEAFKESESRILSMSLIHQELYESGKLDSLDFSSYLRKLVADLLESYNTENAKIKVNLDLNSAFLGVDTAISLGIIINELFTNSIKYAFPEGKGGEISISLTREKTEAESNQNKISNKISSQNSVTAPWINKKYTLIFADNGKGFPEDCDFRNSNSLGLQLVNALVDQIDGCIELRKEHGTKFIIRFRDYEKYK
ncbi:MAG TPA: CHASE4 domain-containing protein [Methanosarcina sp.]|nr:CHASE4 domain-containing protein [Methanosarcina sp.]